MRKIMLLLMFLTAPTLILATGCVVKEKEVVEVVKQPPPTPTPPPPPHRGARRGTHNDLRLDSRSLGVEWA
ncbi:MAG: hypothetical protein ACREOW_15700 [Thermodesulfobacteriota bacterium]